MRSPIGKPAMKTLILIFALTLSAFAQASLTLNVPGEAATSITVSPEMLSSIQQAIKLAPTNPAPATLTVSTTTGSTTFTVDSTTGVKAGMGTLLNNEVCLITAVPSGTTLTVVRARVGTSATATTAPARLVYLNAGSYGQFVKNIIVQWVLQNLQANPGPALTAALNDIAAQQAAIQTILAAAIQ
jgi:hypothetical protein